jgi:hypothetical protein
MTPNTAGCDQRIRYQRILDTRECSLSTQLRASYEWYYAGIVPLALLECCEYSSFKTSPQLLRHQKQLASREVPVGFPTDIRVGTVSHSVSHNRKQYNKLYNMYLVSHVLSHLIGESTMHAHHCVICVTHLNSWLGGGCRQINVQRRSVGWRATSSDWFVHCDAQWFVVF